MQRVCTIHTQSITLSSVFAYKRDLKRGSRDDLRVLWNALGHNGRLYDHVGEQFFAKDEGEASWIRLCQIMDLTEGGWLQQQECEEDASGLSDEHEQNGVEDLWHYG